MSKTNNGIPHKRRRLKSALFRAGALVVGLLAGLALAEVGLRAYLAYLTRGELKNLSLDVPSDPGKWLSLGDLVYPVESVDLVYRLKPGAVGLFVRGPVRINSDGFHDDELPTEKRPGDKRVMVLGDSFTFGWGVSLSDAYPNVLERSLRRLAGSSTRVDVANLAAPGYNAVMEVEIFKQEVDRLKPDAVVVQYCNNDTLAPAFMMKRKYLREFDRLYLLSYLKAGSQILTSQKDVSLIFPHLYHQRRPGTWDVMSPDDVPDCYRHHIGIEALEKAYRDLRDRCRKRGVALFVLLPPEGIGRPFRYRDLKTSPAHDGIRPILDDLGIDVVDAYPVTRAFAAPRDLAHEDLIVPLPKEIHPNETAHALLARALLAPVAEALFGRDLDKEALADEQAASERRAEAFHRASPAYKPEATPPAAAERIRRILRKPTHTGNPE